MKCPKCNSDIGDDSKFCKECGTNITHTKDVQASVTMTFETPVEALIRGTLFANRYEIIEELGKGGMGKVYRAEDTKIKQEIAIKFIRQEISSDKRTIQRFSNELKSARMISHRNVVPMFHLGEEDGVHYITMEYVAGQNLKGLIRQSGRLALGTAITLAEQVCEGLTEAHKMGVVHRDLKPSNIMVDIEGNAHIMDFGLARSLNDEGITRRGAIIGTPHYMSPEQVEGDDIDQRSDIYSLGVVLYEMLTGRAPFEGDTVLSIALKHKTEVPTEPKELNTQVPEDLNRVIMRCLEKKKEKRYQTADELRLELMQREKEIPKRGKVIFPKKPFSEKLRFKKFLIPASIFLVITVMIMISVFLITNPTSRKQILPSHRQLTFTGDAWYPAISPDGKYIAYISGRYEDSKIVVQDIISGQAIEILPVEFCRYLRWLPDGSELSFSANTNDYGRGFFVISPLGGTPRRLSDFNGSFAWSPDGSQYAWIGEKQMHITSKSNGKTTSISLNLSESVLWIADIDWSPKGSFMLFLTGDKEEKVAIWTISIEGSKKQKIVEENSLITSPRWSPNGEAILYLKQTDLAYQGWEIPISLSTGEPSNAPLPFLPGIQAGEILSISKNGKGFLHTRVNVISSLWLASIEGIEINRTVKTRQLTTGTSIHGYPSISPDGNFISFSRGGAVEANIYILPIEGGSPRQITYLHSSNECPVWSPDGKEIAFGSNEGGTSNIWKVNVEGGAPYQFANTKIDLYLFNLAWSPGTNILYLDQSNRNFHVLNPVTGEKSPLIKDDWGGTMIFSRYSPDGKKVALWGWKSSSTGLFVASLENSSMTLIKEGDFYPIGWSSDGKWIYVSEDTTAKIEILMISVESNRVKTIMSLAFDPEIGIPSLPSVQMTPDGKHFVFQVRKKYSDVWIAENFDPDIK